MKNLDVIVHNAVHNFQLNSEKTSMMLMGVLCEVCHSTEPEGLASGTVFWIDCDKCGVWVHNYCVFQENDVSRKYVCSECSANSH